MKTGKNLRLALPGKGALETATLSFLAECGMKVNRNNPRQYLATMSSLPGVEVVFQRAADIPLLVQDGDAALGITGFDILAEHRGYGEEERDEDEDGEEILVLVRDLGYGGCRLVVAVPETWIDVNSCADLWHLSGYYRTHKGQSLRIATKYPRLVGQFLRRHGITHCKIISPHGALEAAPLTDIADLIVDLTETGTTLRENHLKLLDDGTVLRSQACLIANAQLLQQDEQALHLVSIMLELIEARMQARNRSLLTAHIQAENPETIHRVCARLNESMLSPALEFRSGISEQASSMGANWYTISGVVNVKDSAAHLLETIATLRRAGAVHIHVTPLTYSFFDESISVRTLRERLKRKA
ncbi:MAG TPA: ATP phosphoribosyltransferase [Ktedonobacteraceae bacterium]|jgi:ATP phosphoribosyltransferase|nr:ATP phosphoribosyltransferase [Ktedonobacteraceae bacterium]